MARARRRCRGPSMITENRDLTEIRGPDLPPMFPPGPEFPSQSPQPSQTSRHQGCSGPEGRDYLVRAPARLRSRSAAGVPVAGRSIEVIQAGHSVYAGSMWSREDDAVAAVADRAGFDAQVPDMVWVYIRKVRKAHVFLAGRRLPSRFPAGASCAQCNCGGLPSLSTTALTRASHFRIMSIHSGEAKYSVDGYLYQKLACMSQCPPSRGFRLRLPLALLE
jgi:hypothetical protein